MWYVWEKHYIFPYFNPQSPLLLAATYWGNLIMLSLFAVGYFIWAKRVLVKNKVGKWLFFFIGYPILFTMLANAFTSTEERYSLPVYPLIILFSGLGLYLFVNRKKEENNKLI